MMSSLSLGGEVVEIVGSNGTRKPGVFTREVCLGEPMMIIYKNRQFVGVVVFVDDFDHLTLPGVAEPVAVSDVMLIEFV